MTASGRRFGRQASPQLARAVRRLRVRLDGRLPLLAGNANPTSVGSSRTTKARFQSELSEYRHGDSNADEEDDNLLD